ncbi:hypothetical protein [Streptomyces sp. NBRC 109706]|uniref:hypothetical protein n=1 Tax=Streptomyces sp. NBRC 109706 TaxID=1550035 RepID=UPI000782A826|nr:hypothetical protein [Streptomyces sp. NBRC 109706]
MDDDQAVAEVRRIAEAAIGRHTGHPYPEGIRSAVADERDGDGGAVVVLHLLFGQHAIAVERALIDAGWWVAPLPPIPGNYGPRLRVSAGRPPELPAPPRPVYRPFVATGPPQPPRPAWAANTTDRRR